MPLLTSLLLMTPGEIKTATAVPVRVAPQIDGQLDDPAWRDAPACSDFTQEDPHPGALPSQRTWFKVVFDDRVLYFAIRAEDGQSQAVVARLTRRDRQVESDAVSVEIDSVGDRASAFGFVVNAAGVQQDYLRTGDDAQDYDWDAVWSSAVSRDASGWSAELAIPFTALRFGPGPDFSLRIQVSRYISRLQEQDGWVYQPPTEQGVLLRMGALGGLRRVPHRPAVELRPFALARFDQRWAPPGYAPPGGSRSGFSAGGDLNFHPLRDLTLDATVLPDFAQVEADQVVLNLSTIETFFPEKRPFFLSGADLFSLHDALGNPTRTQLFYSRRVGRPPPVPALGGGERLVQQPLQTDIWGAVKLTGKVSDRVTLALLDAVSRREFAAVQTPDGSLAPRAVAPLSQFGAARIRDAVGDGLTVGAMGTAVNRRDRGLAGPAGCPGDGHAPGPGGRCEADAYAGAMDMSWSSPSGAYVASAALLGSKRGQGPDLTSPDGTLIHSGAAGFGGMAEISKAGGEHLLADLRYEGYSPTLEVDDAGYLARQNLHHVFSRVAWRATQPWGAILRSETGLEADWDESPDGIPLARGFNLNSGMRWSSFWGSWWQLMASPRVYDNRETRDGAAYQRTGMLGVEIGGHSDPRRAVSFGAWSHLSNTLRGYQLDLDAGVGFKPLDRLELSLGPTLDWSGGDPRWFETDGDPQGAHRYLFGDLAARATSLTLRGTYTFSPNLSLQAYAQAFVATGHYGPFYAASASTSRPWVGLSDLQPTSAPATDPDFKDADLNVNVVLRWELRPGSTLFLVYSRAETQGDRLLGLDPNRPDLAALRHGPADDVLLLKIGYWLGS